MNHELIDFAKLRRASRIAYFVFLVGFPIAGFVFGHIFFLTIDLATGPYQSFAKDLSVYGWSAGGVFAGIYSALDYRRVGKSIDAAIQQTQPIGLVSVLLDRSAPFGDRDDAAMDLAAFNDQKAEEALEEVANDPEEDPIIVEQATESLNEIRQRKAQHSE